MIILRARLSLVLLLLLHLGLTACGSSADSGASDAGQARSLTSGEFTLNANYAEVDFSYNELIHVQVLVNGVPGDFILDSGADIFVVSPDFARRAGLPEVGESNIQTIAAVTRVPIRRIDSFELGSIIGVEIDAAEMPLGAIDGIVGVPFFEAGIVDIDYASEKLRIRDPNQTDLNQLQALIGGEIFDAPKFIASDMRVNGQLLGPMRIDTGTGGGIRVSGASGSDFVDSASQTLPVVSNAANGQVPGTAFIAEQVEFFGFLLQEQFAVVQDIPLEVGLVGSQILDQFYIVSDMANGKILLRRDSDRRYAIAQ